MGGAGAIHGELVVLGEGTPVGVEALRFEDAGRFIVYDWSIGAYPSSAAESC